MLDEKYKNHIYILIYVCIKYKKMHCEEPKLQLSYIKPYFVIIENLNRKRTSPRPKCPT